MKVTPLLLAAAVLTSACSKGSPIAAGSEVKIHYTLTVDGAVVDSSVGKEPLPYKQGTGMIVPGLESQMAGHKAGDKFSARVEAKDGYGEHNPAGIKTIPWPAFGGRQNADKMKVGEVIGGQADGRPFQAKVLKIADDGVTLDLNHPLAGKALDFAIEVVEVKAGS